MMGSVFRGAGKLIITNFDALYAYVASRQQGECVPLYRTGFGGHPSWVILRLRWNSVTSKVELAGSVDLTKASGSEFTIGADSSSNIWPTSGAPTPPTWADPDVAGGLVFGANGDWALDLALPDMGDYPLELEVNSTHETAEAAAPNGSWFTVGAHRIADPTKNCGAGAYKNGAGVWGHCVLANGTVFGGSARNAPATGRVESKVWLGSNRPTTTTLNSSAQSLGPVLGGGVQRYGGGGSEASFGFDGTDPVYDAFYVERQGFTARLQQLSVSVKRPA